MTQMLAEVMASADRDAFIRLVDMYVAWGFKRETAQRRAYLELVNGDW